VAWRKRPNRKLSYCSLPFYSVFWQSQFSHNEHNKSPENEEAKSRVVSVLKKHATKTYAWMGAQCHDFSTQIYSNERKNPRTCRVILDIYWERIWNVMTNVPRWFRTLPEMFDSCNIMKGKGKSKVVPLRSIEAHLGDRRYSSYSFLTSAPEGGGVSGQHHAPAALYPRGKSPRYPLYRRLGGPQSRSGRRGYRKNPRDRTPAVESRVRHYTDWATGLTLRTPW
jgi:hypothetical protein